jgi:hypothetical protein
MKPLLPIIAVVIACLVSACSATEQQSSADQQTNLAFLNTQDRPVDSPTNPKNIVTGNQLGMFRPVPCCQP